MGVDNIITFDAHDPRVQNAIPLKGFETVQPTYQFIKALLANVDDIHMNSENMMIISPDEGAMGRAIYFCQCCRSQMWVLFIREEIIPRS